MFNLLLVAGTVFYLLAMWRLTDARSESLYAKLRLAVGIVLVVVAMVVFCLLAPLTMVYREVVVRYKVYRRSCDV
jgi:hypothetical protein